MRNVRSTLLVMLVFLPLTIGECVRQTCSDIPDQPHEGICDPFRN